MTDDLSALIEKAANPDFARQARQADYDFILDKMAEQHRQGMPAGTTPEGAYADMLSKSAPAQRLVKARELAKAEPAPEPEPSQPLSKAECALEDLAKAQRRPDETHEQAYARVLRENPGYQLQVLHHG